MELARGCVQLLSVPLCHMFSEIQVVSKPERKREKVKKVAGQAGLYLEGCGGTDVYFDSGE